MADELETTETVIESDLPPPERIERPAWRLPLLLTLISLLIWFGFQTAELVLERNQLGAVKSNFATAMQEAQKMQSQLEALITKTVELASKGNPNAKVAVEELQRKGIPVQAAAPPANTPPAK